MKLDDAVGKSKNMTVRGVFMSDLFTDIKVSLAKAEKRKIVFPEATEERVLRAACKLADEGLAEPVLIGKEDEVKACAKELQVDLQHCYVVDPEEYGGFDQMVDQFVERRNGKATKTEAEQLLLDHNYFGTMLVYMEEADGLVSGAVHSTSDTVRPALQIIKTKPGIKRTSGVFVMVRKEEKYLFGDCAINIAPSSEELAEIAVESEKTAALFNIDPRIAMLSFSTKGSAQSEETERVKASVSLALEKNNSLVIDGELQFDAAFVPAIQEKKAPASPLQGEANVFVFPSLEAGNIGYKMMERLGGFEAVGPILQGLQKPVNDLSRGCDEEDVYKLALITALQATSSV